MKQDLQYGILENHITELMKTVVVYMPKQENYMTALVMMLFHSYVRRNSSPIEEKKYRVYQKLGTTFEDT